MAGNFTDFGDLVLIIGDFHVPQRAIDLPPCFRELLHTDKIRHVLCTGNVGSEQILEFLKGISGSVHIVKGDMDGDADFPEYKILQFGILRTIGSSLFAASAGEFKVALLHGHQVVPWGGTDALLQWQRKLDCDILVSGHTHSNSVREVEGRFFINPGSATGAYQPWAPNPTPSFMLMALQGASVVLYIYEERGGKAEVVMSEFTKPPAR